MPVLLTPPTVPTPRPLRYEERLELLERLARAGWLTTEEARDKRVSLLTEARSMG
ncbi:hypothetical protein [Pedococcus sp. 5OH_020]|uniref:hypothetical protein n=1 Tax=Pedococcus sp. 5OH_020 TaxID=2989814 RepID=UPI0022EA00C6|nr:hypothetical protein [Pedococcus sp. 5OH_020]